MTLRLLSADRAAWSPYLAHVPHDFFHTPEYQKTWAGAQGGEAFLAVYGDADKYLAWPYVQQAISGFQSADGKPLYDISSAYGFDGPLLYGCEGDTAFLEKAWAAFCETWRAQAVVTVFTRFHPVLANHRWVQQISAAPAAGGIVGQGKTVAIDLSKSEDEIWTGYKRQLRQSIRRAMLAGVRVVHDPDWIYFADFLRLYYFTMRRNRAAQFYYFPPVFFHCLKAAAGSHSSLMVSLYQDRVIAAALVLNYGHIANVLLLGTDSEYLSLSPAKLLFHHTHAWARDCGSRYLHFGGGRGGRDGDTLFRFKTLFSNLTFPFYTGRWILNEARYGELLRANRDQTNPLFENDSTTEEFFPRYRTRI